MQKKGSVKEKSRIKAVGVKPVGVKAAGVKVTEAILRKHLAPLLKFKKLIEGIYVYGSAVTKQSANDIDVLIILNDMEKTTEAAAPLLEKFCEVITAEGAKKGLNFHFQPTKTLSKWWQLLIDGEPWIVSSLKEVIVIHDANGLIREVREFIEEEHIYRKEEKAERLIERSDEVAMKNRQLLLTSISSLVNAATEAAQILLLFNNQIVLNKKQIVVLLQKNYSSVFGEDVIGNYAEIVDLEDKAAKGMLGEFSAENLDYYLEKTKKFIAKVETMMGGK